MKKRTILLTRKTNETSIRISLNLDGKGVADIKTPIGFLNHMLELFSMHSFIDLSVIATGDIGTDDHHIVEDIAILLGTAFLTSIGEKKGINRYGFFILPMDDALATVALDLSGRYSYRFDCDFVREKVGDLSTELIEHFWNSFAQNAKINLFIEAKYGKNEHHKIEAIFKSVARAIRMACAVDDRVPNQIPSTKGVL